MTHEIDRRGLAIGAGYGANQTGLLGPESGGGFGHDLTRVAGLHNRHGSCFVWLEWAVISENGDSTAGDRVIDKIAPIAGGAGQRKKQIALFDMR